MRKPLEWTCDICGKTVSDRDPRYAIISRSADGHAARFSLQTRLTLEDVCGLCHQEVKLCVDELRTRGSE